MYNRQEGWEGSTYVEALVFCAKKGRAICPYEAVCPAGEMGEPLGGYRDGSSGDWEWIPIIDSFNEWVQSSAREKCVKYSDKYGKTKPQWHADEKTGKWSGEAITENIMCCTTTTSEG